MSFRRRDGSPPLVFGHRGVRGVAPENTMSAFELAADAGADGVELDVRTCRSGELVVCHDPTLERCSSGRDLRAVAEVDLADLARADVGAGQGVPSLAKVLDWARDRSIKVNVEIKRDVPDRRAVVRETARVLGGLGPQLADIIVSSFDPWMLGYFGWLLPGALRGSLFGADQKLQSSGWVTLMLGADAVHPERVLALPERCRKWKQRGNIINVWTVNEPDEAKELAALGVDGIVSDFPRTICDAVR